MVRMKWLILFSGLLSLNAFACEFGLLADVDGTCRRLIDFPGTTVENCQAPFSIFQGMCLHPTASARTVRSVPLRDTLAIGAAQREARAAAQAEESGAADITRFYNRSMARPESERIMPESPAVIAARVADPDAAEVPAREGAAAAVVVADPARADAARVSVPSATTSSQESLADTFASYDPASCQWTADLPRKLHSAPGCTRSSTNQICVGYVVCNARTGGGKFVRTATCGADKCGSSEAVACVNDRAHYSAKPEESVGRYMSDRVRSRVLEQ